MTTGVPADAAKRRVLVIGADGLRPDLFDRALMPNVAALEATGIRFADHHAAYPSHTRVNMSSLATGTAPGRHGIVANTMLVAGATSDHVVDTSSYQHLDALDRFSGGRALFVPTLADLLARQGERVAVAGTGSSGSNLLWTRNDRARIVNTGSAYGIADLYDLREKLGEIPEAAWPQVARTRYAARAVTDLFLDDPRNRVVVVWFSEPDASLHRFGLGAPETIEAMRVVDEGVGEMVAALERSGLRDRFDVVFLSDHGHSTVRSHNSLRDYLIQAAADLGGHLPPLVTASDFVYAEPGTPEPEPERLAPLVAWLYAQPWCDVVFAGQDGAEALPGVLPLAALWNGATNPRRPLLAVSPRWSHEANAFGVPGTVSALTTQAALKSSHGSASPYDMHALMIANGPSFREGIVSDVPTGAVDLAPTLMTLLGLPAPEPLDGRVLWEGLRGEAREALAAADTVLEPLVAGRRDDSPRLRLHQVGNTSYVHGSAVS
ncbi:MAG: hypothetical protein AVDCRST_MAG19-4228 [uncultured Thermomicrobiales bacterium]|uniref:Uncharacterized protein n=1 Tax=uncultured Thermomicrobiales bacterium TaxID=1645740 RepID=A0A6J4VLT4_9BACT|nr:MAG: hypothetical protein AVDCRST_MAG19-4228 [uncultured Thermomicrobiales bacterium]